MVQWFNSSSNIFIRRDIYDSSAFFLEIRVGNTYEVHTYLNSESVSAIFGGRVLELMNQGERYPITLCLTIEDPV